MYIRSKVRAFTLSEMIVVLVISTIVISLAVAVLGFVQKQVHSIQNNIQQQTEVMMFERILASDVNLTMLFFDQRDSVLICKTPNSLITYRFKKEFSLRNLDTLPVGVSAFQMYSKGFPVSDGLVDAISLELNTLENTTPLFVFKPNDATFYMNAYDF